MKKVREFRSYDLGSGELFDIKALQEKEPELFEELIKDYPIENARKTIIIETDKMIDLVALSEKEPDLFNELAGDYPCEAAKYIFEVKE